jgi:hypothetical protein
MRTSVLAEVVVIGPTEREVWLAGVRLVATDVSIPVTPEYSKIMYTPPLPSVDIETVFAPAAILVAIKKPDVDPPRKFWLPYNG